MVNTEPTITIRVYASDWRKLERVFPAEKGESLCHYLRRYVRALKNGQ